MAEVQWFEDHYVDEDGKRYALSVPWQSEWLADMHIPKFLLLTPEQRRAGWGPGGEPKITAAVTPPPVTGASYRVYLQGELPSFGSGWHTLKAEIGLKWVRVTNEKGKVRRITVDQFNLLNPEMIIDVVQQGATEDLEGEAGGDGGAL